MSDPGTISTVPVQPVIQFLRPHRVLLLHRCPKSTCIPRGIGGHLLRHHRDQFTPDQRTKLANEARKHPALAPQSLLKPRREDGPVTGLYVHDGWECKLCCYVRTWKRNKTWMGSKHAQDVVGTNCSGKLTPFPDDNRPSPPASAASISQSIRLNHHR
jgi:hypothetical protein